MKRITWTVALLLAGCGSPQSSTSVQQASRPGSDDDNNGKQPNLKVTPDPLHSDLTCPSPTACFRVTSDKNITHIFVDVAPDTTCEGETPSIAVSVDGVNVPSAKFHTNGGPCNHGEELVTRILWFPLTGNQKTADVCVTTSGVAVSDISVGAKSAEECLASSEHPACECPPAPSPSPTPSPTPTPSPSCPPDL